MPHIRSLEVYADGRQIAQGCRLRLTGSETLSLRPGFFLLTVWDLSPSSASLLSAARRLEIRSGSSILASGDICDVHTGTCQGRQITEAGFSPGLSLWESSVSLSVPSGTSLSDTVRALLSASGTGIPLVSFTGTEQSFSRGQAFFCRTASALETLAAAANAFAWLSPAGLVLSGKKDRNVTLFLPDVLLLSAPSFVRGCAILTTSMVGWPAGSCLRYTWQGTGGEGRLLARSIDADNDSGPWKSELMIRTDSAG